MYMKLENSSRGKKLFTNSKHSVASSFFSFILFLALSLHFSDTLLNVKHCHWYCTTRTISHKMEYWDKKGATICSFWLNLLVSLWVWVSRKWCGEEKKKKLFRNMWSSYRRIYRAILFCVIFPKFIQFSTVCTMWTMCVVEYCVTLFRSYVCLFDNDHTTFHPV